MVVKSSSWTIVPKAVLAIIIYLQFLSAIVHGAEDVYSNSFISPNSARDHNHIQELDKRQSMVDTTFAPSEISIASSSSLEELNTQSPLKELHRVERSADPILSKTSGIDNLLSYKNIEDSLDSNDVELSGRIAQLIQPSKTNSGSIFIEAEQTIPLSGEGKGVPQARSLLGPQEIMPTATTTAMHSATLSFSQPSKGRQANPDIQDIITGIVKLLNGNVNVQANTSPERGRPLRPVSTRINNRGPPRITDVPALPPDFDVPAPPLPPPPLGQMPPPVSNTRLPTPYPFDVPPNISPVRPQHQNIPLSESTTTKKRPGIYRPVTIPPWTRPRRPPSRRPIPPYKPLSQDMISLTSDKPMEDILTLDLGGHLSSHESSSDREKVMESVHKEISSTESSTNIELESSESVQAENNNKIDANEISSKQEEASLTETESTIKEFSSTSALSNQTINDVKNTTSSIQETSTSTVSTTSVDLSITSTSLEFSTNSTSNRNEINATVTKDDIGLDSTPVLESSIQEVLQTLKEELLQNQTKPTEVLPNATSSLVESMKTELKPTTPSSINNGSSTHHQFPYYPYRPRPGIVLDDTEYKPGGINKQPIITRPPISQLGDIFDITVSAIQGPGGASSAGQGKPYIIPVDIENVHGGGGGGSVDVITSPVGEEGFVSIDGKRTYLNLFGDSTNTQPPSPSSSSSSSSGSVIKPTAPVQAAATAAAASHNQVTGTGFAVVETEKAKPPIKPTQRRPPLYGRPRPSQPPVRIDTCIVGDDSTCDVSQHEICKTEMGVSACHCRPGTARRKHRDPCRKIVSVLLSLRVDRLYERKVVWANELADKDSDSFQQLSYEAERALESAMSMTPFSDEFLGSKVNSIYKGERAEGQAGVFVNLTLQLEENADTARPTVRGDIQRHLLGVIQRRSNNVGNSALWVDSPPGSVSNLQDLDECSSPELHDCHSLARCINIFGGFKCECGEGYRDPWIDNKHRAGRHCEQCSPQHCNNRGECKYQNGQEVCVCSGNYYGTQCELDGEVLGVAIGASVAAVIIIGLTLVCLVMWSRKWSREHKAAIGSPVFGYMATASNTVKTPVVGAPPYQLTLEDRLRWAQIADVMAQANHYAPEPVTGPTRPSSALFGYPNLSMTGTLQSMHGTLPPVPLPRLNLQAQLASRANNSRGMRPLDNSSSSEEEDKADLLGRSFQVPRPKSRSNASIANQSGIYYDVDYDQNEIYKQSGGIPLSTYSMGRPSYFRN